MSLYLPLKSFPSPKIRAHLKVGFYSVAITAYFIIACQLVRHSAVTLATFGIMFVAAVALGISSARAFLSSLKKYPARYADRSTNASQNAGLWYVGFIVCAAIGIVSISGLLPTELPYWFATTLCSFGAIICLQVHTHWWWKDTQDRLAWQRIGEHV